MVSSETVDRMGLDAAGGSLQDTLSVIGKNVTCSDLNAPLKKEPVRLLFVTQGLL